MTPEVTKYVIGAAVVGLSLYDVAVGSIWGREMTISVVINEWAKNVPMIAVLIGVLVGHWFWMVE